MFKFLKTKKLEERKAECIKIMNKYPDRIPVIVERYPDSTSIQDIDKNKFLVPKDFTIAQFIVVIRRRIKLAPENALFIFINNQIPPNSKIISQIYQENKSECGYLLVFYNGETTFG
jgi:GABA(A) receptor-associated protein